MQRASVPHNCILAAVPNPAPWASCRTTLRNFERMEGGPDGRALLLVNSARCWSMTPVFGVRARAGRERCQHGTGRWKALRRAELI